MDILQILKAPLSRWNREAPASPEAIQSLINESPIDLPEEYLALLRYSNGGEGYLAIEPRWFQLWPAEMVIELNKSYEVEQNAPGFFGFGSNGGGEMLAFDTREGKPWRIAMLPFIPMTPENAIVTAQDFKEFIHAMGYEHTTQGLVAGHAN